MPLPPLRSTPPAGLVVWTPADVVLAALADAADGAFEVDLTTGSTVWSLKLFELFAVDPATTESTAQAFGRLHADDAAAVDAAIDTVPYAVAFRIVLPDGTLRWLSARGRIVAGHGGPTLVGQVTDDTARRGAETEIARTEQRRDRFLSLLAHDLRNPLAPLHTAAELMRRSEMQPARIRTISEMLSRQVTQMSHLIDDLVDVSRANQGKLELRREALDLHGVVELAVASVNGFVERRRQTIETRFEQPSAMLDGDAERLVQIVTHLLEHASRASTEDAVIRVTVHAEPGRVRLDVADDGAGIEADRLAQVWDLYPTVDGDPHRRQTLGTGMALVKSLAELHGGSVAAASAGVGHGATYTVHLPTP